MDPAALRSRLPVAPTLLRLARSPSRIVPRAEARAAFTLIEIMISVVLSMVIVFTAVSAFRLASRTISITNALSTENSLLRVGFQASLEDVDFYHSEADASQPYNKGFTRLRSDPSYLPMQPGYGARRHFQPLPFSPSTDPDVQPFDEPVDAARPAFTTAWSMVANPNVMLAHDPRSIDRSHILGNTTPFLANGSWDLYYRHFNPRFAIGDYRLVACTDMRFAHVASGVASPWGTPQLVDPLFPYAPAGTPVPAFARDMDGKLAGLAPGPYTVSGEIDASDPAMPPLVCPVRTVYNQAIPLLAWQTFSRMSLHGLAEYLPGEVSPFIQDQDGKGPNDHWHALPPALPDNFFTTPKGYPEAPGAGQDSLPGLWGRSYPWGTRDVAGFLGCDFREGRTWALVTLPVLAERVGNDACYDRSSVYLQMIMGGTVAGGQTSMNWSTRVWMAGGGQDTGDVARNDRRLTSRTYRLPYNISDGDRTIPARATVDSTRTVYVPHYAETPLDLDNKPSAYPVLSTSILRYRRFGGVGGLTVATSVVEDRLSGKRLELVCVPYGSSFRGARQHWRLYSPAFSDANAIGDFYDTSAGPFYAP